MFKKLLEKNLKNNQIFINSIYHIFKNDFLFQSKFCLN